MGSLLLTAAGLGLADENPVETNCIGHGTGGGEECKGVATYRGFVRCIGIWDEDVSSGPAGEPGDQSKCTGVSPP